MSQEDKSVAVQQVEEIKRLKQDLQLHKNNAQILAIDNAQQAEQLAALELALENSENRHVFEAPEGMCFMPENTPEQLATLAEQCEKMRTVISKSRELVCAGAGCGFNPLSGNGADELFSNQAKLTEALALPDIATPALNRIEARGMLKAAEICDNEEGTCGMGTVLADKLRARAAELGKAQ